MKDRAIPVHVFGSINRRTEQTADWLLFSASIDASNGNLIPIIVQFIS